MKVFLKRVGLGQYEKTLKIEDDYEMPLIRAALIDYISKLGIVDIQNSNDKYNEMHNKALRLINHLDYKNAELELNKTSDQVI
jgi:hypothetical protein